jgi:hypothetical protein
MKRQKSRVLSDSGLHDQSWIFGRLYQRSSLKRQSWKLLPTHDINVEEAGVSIAAVSKRCTDTNVVLK